MQWHLLLLLISVGGSIYVTAFRRFVVSQYRECNGGLRLSATPNQFQQSLPQLKRTSLAILSSIVLGSVMPYSDITIQPFYSPTIAHADSTGKMSTKLTARKRYLPRITEGIKKFNSMAQNSKSQESDAFLTGKESQSASLIRAMNLYGASLRKGEIPDSISRRAEELTANFKNDLAAVEKFRTIDSISSARTSLDAFLEFASLPSSIAK